MHRLLRLFLGPLVGFGVSAFITIVGLHVLPREVVAPVAVGAGIAAVTYLSPTGRRRRSVPFSVALGALVALFFYISLRFLAPTPE